MILVYRNIDTPPGTNTNPVLNRVLMIRAPRMVIYEVPVTVTGDQSLAGLFLVNSKELVKANNKAEKDAPLDDAFRECESATHSEWNYQDLKPMTEQCYLLKKL